MMGLSWRHWVMGWLSWYSVRLQTQRPEVRTPPGAQEQFVRVFLSQECCAEIVIDMHLYIIFNLRLFLFILFLFFF